MREEVTTMGREKVDIGHTDLSTRGPDMNGEIRGKITFSYLED